MSKEVSVLTSFVGKYSCSLPQIPLCAIRCPRKILRRRYPSEIFISWICGFEVLKAGYTITEDKGFDTCGLFRNPF